MTYNKNGWCALVSSLPFGTIFNKFNSGFSIEVYYNASESQGGLIGLGSSDGHKTIAIYPDQIITFGEDTYLINGPHLGTHHMVVTYLSGATTLDVYVDGEYSESVTITGTLDLSSPQYLFQGQWMNTKTHQLVGTVYRTRMFSKGLTAQEIQSLYQCRDM